MKKLTVNQSWCKGCGICVAFCPKNVLEMKGDKIQIKNESACIYCSLCQQRCPDYAIYIDENKAEGSCNAK